MSKYAILSVDGGGIRGVIPAVIINALSEKLGSHPSKVFDCFAGTSTGAILAAGLVTPQTQGSALARHQTDEIINLYEQLGPKSLKPRSTNSLPLPPSFSQTGAPSKNRFRRSTS